MAETSRKTEIPPELLREVVNPWLLGADPEFSVLRPPGDEPVPNAGEFAVAANILAGQIGSDHGGRVWELRPAPSSSAYGVVTNVWKLLKSESMNRVEQFKWKSGGVARPTNTAQVRQILLGNGPRVDTIGGHVHFGLARLTPAQHAALNAATQGLEILEILPGAESMYRREIGRIDAIRDSTGHVEFRTPPSWLGSPGQALAVLTTLKLAAAKPASVTWPGAKSVKARFIDWLGEMSALDVDAWLLHRFVEKRGLAACQTDPASDFKPNWRKEELWQQAA